VTSPSVTVSAETKPDREPEPYWMANSVPFLANVEDDLESYLWCSLHAMLLHEQLLDGTHRFDEPVSKTTSNCCGGVPIEIGP